MNPETGIPEVDESKCTACGACVKACPKSIIEIRPVGKKSRRIYVQCVNKDKGAIARKACTVACIGCGKCVKVCAFEAITLENNLAYIDYNKCKSCRKCEEACPQGSIIALNASSAPSTGEVKCSGSIWSKGLKMKFKVEFSVALEKLVVSFANLKVISN